MESVVILSKSIEDYPFIDRLAVGIALFHDTGKYPDFLGHFGRFENNQQAIESQLNKIHIALYRSDWSLKTWRNRNGYNRTSDNFIVYARHFFHDNYYLILDIVTPDAHRRINALLPELIRNAESFHQQRLTELNQYTHYTAKNVEIVKSITLTT